MELDVQAVGDRIKKRRKELGLTQMDIKEKTGISSGNISDIEHGNRLPAATTLVQLAEVLDCSIDYILIGPPFATEHGENSFIGESAQQLLSLFYALPPDEQEELLMIAQIKVNKGKRAKSPFLENESPASETA